MNNIINPTRLKGLVKYEWVHSKNYILFLTTTLFVLALASILGDQYLSGTKGINLNIISNAFIALSMMGFGSYVASNSFNYKLNTFKSIVYLSLPASRTEKFLLLFISSTIVLPFLILGIFEIATLFAKWLTPLLLNHDFLKKTEFSNTTSLDKEFILYSFMQSVFFLGGIYFKRYAYLKTLIVCTLLFIISFLGMGTILTYLFHQNFSFVNDFMQQHNGNVQVEDQTSSLIFMGFTIIFWGITYWKFQKTTL